MTLATVALNCAKQIGRVNAAGTSITDLETEIKEQIQETIRYYNRKSWAPTEFRGFQFTTAASTTWYSTVDLTSGDGDQSTSGRTSVDVNTILAINYMRTNPGASGQNEPLWRRSYQEFEKYFEGSTPTGIPTYYTVYAGQIGLWPSPSQAYTVYGSGSVKPTVPTSDSDTSVWFDQANELIEAGALKRVCVKYLRDRDRARDFETMERDQMGALSGETLLRSSSGKLKAND